MKLLLKKKQNYDNELQKEKKSFTNADLPNYKINKIYDYSYDAEFSKNISFGEVFSEFSKCFCGGAGRNTDNTRHADEIDSKQKQEINQLKKRLGIKF